MVPAHSDTRVRKTQDITPTTASDWDAPFAGQPQFGIFHSAAWSAVLNRTYGFRPVYFSTNNGNEIPALLPLMEVSSRLTGKRGISLPFTDFCEPLGTAAERKSLFENALQLGRKNGWKYLECRAEPKNFGLSDAWPSLSFYGHALEIAEDANRLFAGFKPSVQRAVRKAERSGLIVEISTKPDAVREYYSLHCQTRKRHGLPPQPFRFFRNIHEEIIARGMGFVISAKVKNRVAASAIFFHYGAKAIYKFGASDPALLDFRANNLVMWEAIQWCARAGKKTLDFGRTSLANEGLRRFKLGWGAVEHRINYFKYDFQKNTFVTDRDEVYGWHNRVFHVMPTSAARLVGALLYKHIA
ncbi:MAG TPA: GNAT family N-acetyltransferase [Verrucomicrobiae bacterium]|nr:GNAT family N-acetyltransferase [Verrucomicrobiae bacterium]